MKPVVVAPQSLGPLMVKLKREPWAVNFRRPWWTFAVIVAGRMAVFMFLPSWVESQKVSNLMKPPRENSVAAKASRRHHQGQNYQNKYNFFHRSPL